MDEKCMKRLSIGMFGILFCMMMVVLVNEVDVRAAVGISGDEENNVIVMPFNEEYLKELVQENFQNDNNENYAYFVTDDAPENIYELIATRAGDYTVHHYSRTAVFQKTNFWGNKYDYITIVVSGDTYEYTDGKVHLYSMGVSATIDDTGWTKTIDTPVIVNTNGAMSYGYSFVYFTKVDKYYEFGCFVSLTNSHPLAEVDITQIT